jgi:hypothetical protein
MNDGSGLSVIAEKGAASASPRCIRAMHPALSR